MVHLVGFRDGKAFYRNRFVRTEAFEAEQEAGESLWVGLAERPGKAKRTDGWGARGHLKDSSSTDVVVHNGMALTSFYECGDLYRLDPLTLEPRGRSSWNGEFPHAAGVSAHPKVDEHTGEMMFFNYGRTEPFLHYGVLDPDDALVHYVGIDLPGPRIPHDMAFTENYAILNDLPMFWDPALMDRGRYVPGYQPEFPTRPGHPRRGQPEEIRWFEGPDLRPALDERLRAGPRVVLEGSSSTSPSRGCLRMPVTTNGCHGSSRSTGCRPSCTGGG
jgi:carotenoid cleavage dioxygenase